MKKLIYIAMLFVLLCSAVYATTSNYTVFVDGNVLNASDLNNFQTHYTNADNAILDGDNFTGNMNWYGGSDAVFWTNSGVTKTVHIYGDTGKIETHQAGDIVMYSNDGTAVAASIDGATGKLIAGLESQAVASNCSVVTSGSTTTIKGNTSDLSDTNPCIIAVRSNTTGQTILSRFTSNVQFSHGESSDIDENLYGITDAVWSYDMPFFIGVVTNGTDSYFTLSRLPFYKTGSASTTLCQKAEVTCEAQEDVMILATGLTLSSFVNLPITQVAWIKATYSSAETSFEMSQDADTGFNDNYESVRFQVPQGVNGAQTGTYFFANGGTAADFSTIQAYYTITKAGLLNYTVYLNGDGGTDGSGAVESRLVLPYDYPSGSVDVLHLAVGYGSSATTLSSGAALLAVISENTSYAGLRYLDASAIPSLVTNAMMSNGGREFRISINLNVMYN